MLEEKLGKTIGIIGLGSIGKEVSKLMNNIGLKVIVYDVNVDLDFLNRNSKIKNSTLKEVYNNSDYISLHTPLNEKTKYMIDYKCLDLMKEDVVIINTARGELVRKGDIILGLEKNKLRGYLCDVLDKEPIEPGEEFLKKKRSNYYTSCWF